ncbi:NAD(P)H-hydrate dehydratase [uncultured Paracoccus sp.]|uniref:NAD(P)H-hydrate dehydratase n=1 Tax=uncultured Paracoccus sp. TaxID=189685 RepID=UPI00261CFA79|nr:NAD(P)H-hydrate dehydratase [uncultured Paracoccus sp.]
MQIRLSQVLTPERMRKAEAAAMDSGQVTGLQLMERAGAAVAGHIRLRWPRPAQVTVLCGPGNNGGDGYVIARHLQQAGWRVRVLGMANTPGPDAAEMKRQWLRMGGVEPLTAANLQQNADHLHVVVDAIFGIGLTRPPKGEIAAVLSLLADPRAGGIGNRIVAVDCPSGLCLDSGRYLGTVDARRPAARLTVTFDSPKPGHLLAQGPAACGELVIADIGLRSWRDQEVDGPNAAGLAAIWPEFDGVDHDVPDQTERTPANMLGSLAKVGSRGAHKFDHGHALVVAGGAGRGGAARLSARAALRIGAGLVTIAAPAAAQAEHASRPDALMRRSVDDAGDLHALLGDGRVTALCIGPGCGVERAGELLPAVLACRRACVLDADALTALATIPRDRLHDRCVLTPHGGEFARLFPDLAARLAEPALHGPAFSRVDAARAAAGRCGAVVLLKGPDTVIAAPDGRVRIHSAFDVPWLATAGSGDVLAGTITGLLARGLDPVEAASLGALVHAQAARGFGPGLIADDLPDHIPAALSALGV